MPVRLVLAWMWRAWPWPASGHRPRVGADGKHEATMARRSGETNGMHILRSARAFGPDCRTMCCWVAYSRRLCHRRHRHDRGDVMLGVTCMREKQTVFLGHAMRAASSLRASIYTHTVHARPCYRRFIRFARPIRSHIPGPPSESSSRSEPDDLHWSLSACRGTETCVPSAYRNRLSPSQWCNGRATFVCGAWQANALHVSRLHR